MANQQTDGHRNNRRSTRRNTSATESRAPVDHNAVIPSSHRQQSEISCLTYYHQYGYVLSNEYGSLKISRELLFFERLIDPARIRDVWMIIAYPKTAAEHAADDLELERVIRTLRAWNCRNIQRAILHMFCFSQNTWLTSLAHIARNNLTYLSLLTVVHRSRFGTALTYVLINFPQLQHLYFGTRCHTVAYFKDSPNESADVRYSRVSTWDQVNNVPVPSSFQHTNLASIHLESDDYYEPGWLEDRLFQLLPRLRELRLSGEIYHPQLMTYGNYPGFYSQLLRHCPLITSFRYDHRMAFEYIRAFSQQCYEEYAEQSELHNHFTEQTGNLTRTFYFTSTCSVRNQPEPVIVHHFRGIVSACSRTLTEMKLVLLHNDFLDYASQFDFPRLVSLDLFLDHPRSRLMMLNNPYFYISPTNQWIDLLRKMPNLINLVLGGVKPHEGVADVLQDILPQLESVRLDWKDHFYGTTFCKAINMREQRAGNT